MHAGNVLEVGLDIFRLDWLEFLCVHDITHAAVSEVKSSGFVLVKDVRCDAD